MTTTPRPDGEPHTEFCACNECYAPDAKGHASPVPAGLVEQKANKLKERLDGWLASMCLAVKESPLGQFDLNEPEQAGLMALLRESADALASLSTAHEEVKAERDEFARLYKTGVGLLKRHVARFEAAEAQVESLKAENATLKGQSPA